MPGGEQVEEGDDGALELGAVAGVDGGRGEALPDDRLADCLNEEIDAGALLLQLVPGEYDEAGQTCVWKRTINREYYISKG